jgi:hypothetical protein
MSTPPDLTEYQRLVITAHRNICDELILAIIKHINVYNGLSPPHLIVTNIGDVNKVSNAMAEHRSNVLNESAMTITRCFSSLYALHKSIKWGEDNSSTQLFRRDFVDCILSVLLFVEKNPPEFLKKNKSGLCDAWRYACPGYCGLYDVYKDRMEAILSNRNPLL